MKAYYGWFACVVVFVSSLVAASGEVAYPGGSPGKAVAEMSEDKATLSNALFTATFVRENGAIRFGGMTDAKDAAPLLKGGTELFSMLPEKGKELSASNMKASAWSIVDLPGNPRAVKLSERVPGKALRATFKAPDGSFSVEWMAVLRDGSHYLRQELKIKALRDTGFRVLTPMMYRFAGRNTPEVVGNTTHGRLVVSEKLFAGLETPMSIMTVGGERSAGGAWTPDKWTPDSFSEVFENDIPAVITQKYGKMKTAGPVARGVKMAGGTVNFARAGKCDIAFLYRSGNLKLNMLGVILCDAGGKIVSHDVHEGHSGTQMQNNVYTIQVPSAGAYTLQYWVDTRTEGITSSGEVTLSLPLRGETEETVSKAAAQLVQGAWERKTTLPKGKSWQVSGVVGLFAPGQQRRSFLAYSEREKAVPYRLFIHYNDWYEVGIRLHDNSDPLKRTSEKIWRGILQHWERELFQKRKTSLDAFVIDDGWDDFDSLWDFHAGFPNGFAAISRSASKMKAGVGTWLGPVGGYGKSKAQRLAYWNRKHPSNRINNFELSNREYFDAFVGRCRDMIRKYDMRYFKFDGISTHFHSKGPAGLEDAEGIIEVAKALRREREDIFINATVGTWASPFWYHYVDSVWRQENDFDQMGTMGDARDKWITYRDRLVYNVFVQGMPFFPINSIMTHGLIITRNGPPRVMSKEPQNCIKEMRAAFGSGSGLQEVYVDSDLMDQENGRLWDELAACIAWIRRNEDVLPDVHWVGGNPWDNADGNIYGWAAWNKKKCTLTLRNSSNREKTLQVTLREVFDVPAHLKGSITLRSSFADQRELSGIVNEMVDVDKTLSITLKPMEVIVMEGSNALKGKRGASN